MTKKPATQVVTGCFLFADNADNFCRPASVWYFIAYESANDHADGIF
jgi:hypothetical protein